MFANHYFVSATKPKTCVRREALRRMVLLVLLLGGSFILFVTTPLIDSMFKSGSVYYTYCILPGKH